MTSVSVNAEKAQVDVVATKTQVAISKTENKLTVLEQPNQIEVIEQGSATLVVQAPVKAEIAVQESASGFIVLETSTPSLPTLLNAVRTDISDAVFTYNGEQLTEIVREGITKAFTYNNDGTLNTSTTVVSNKTVIQTFSYDSNKNLTSITVS